VKDTDYWQQRGINLAILANFPYVGYALHFNAGGGKYWQTGNNRHTAR